VSGEPSPDEVRALFERGSDAYRVGAYDDAIQAFGEAYDRSKMPALLFNVAQAQRMKGDCPAALVSYRKYIELAPTASNRSRTDARIEELEARCGQDKEPSIERSSSPKTTTATPNARTPIAISPPPTMPVAEAGPHWFRSRVTAVSLIGAAAAVASVGLIFSWKAASAATKTSELFRRGGSWDPEARAVESEGQHSERTAIVFYCVAGVMGAVGVWSYVTSDGSRISVIPRAGKGTEIGGAAVQWTSAF
jgi:hypothetical protein